MAYFMLSATSPLQRFEFLNTRRKARKKIQYSMAINITIPDQSRVPNSHKNNKARMAIPTHANTASIDSPHPSAAGRASKAISGLISELKGFLHFNREDKFPTSSFNFTPLYNPIKIKRKKAMDNIPVETMEFINMVRCW